MVDAADISVSDGESQAKAKKNNFSGFAALQAEDTGPVEEEEEDFGGLMVRSYSHSHTVTN